MRCDRRWECSIPFGYLLQGWRVGPAARSRGDEGFGTGADILLGITGAFGVRWSLENFSISLEDVYLLLFSIWGAAAFPAAVGLVIKHHNRSKARAWRWWDGRHVFRRRSPKVVPKLAPLVM